VRFFWSYRDRVFVHPNAFIVVTPEGRVARYLYGTLVKVAASGQLIDILAGVCFSYNFKEGRYTINVPLFVGMGSLLLGISLVVVSFLVAKKKMHRREATNG